MQGVRLLCAALLAGLSANVTAPARSDGSVGDPRVYEYPDTVQVESERILLDPLKVPMATTVLLAAEWKSGRSGGLDEALAHVPGILAQSRAGGQDVRITNRGFGARGAGERSNAGTTRGIRVTLDGFPLTEPDGRTSLDLADLGLLERIRVVRSNTSTLFGPASGGLIDLYSVTPFVAPFAEVRAEFGSFGFARQQVQAGFISGSARIHLSGSTGNFEGWRKHSGGSQSTLLASVQADPSVQTSFGVFLAATHTLQRQAGALTREEFKADPEQADPAYLLQDARRDNRIGRIGAKLDQRFGDGQVLKFNGFLEPKTIHRSERNRYRDFQRVFTGGSAVYSVPLRLGSAGARWTAGIDDAYQDGSILFYSLGPGGSRGTDLAADKREGINTFGAFTEASVTPAPRWEATAGARWDLVHYIFEDHVDPSLDNDRTLKRASPRVSLSFRPTGHHTLYATVNGGIETPAFNEVDPPAPYDTLTGLNPFLKPVYSTTYEVGAKGESRFGRGARGRFGYDAALYTLAVRNELVPWDGGAYYFTAGRSRRTGLELGLSAATDYGVSLRVAGNLSRNRYVDYVNNDGRYDGNETAGVPSVVLSLAGRYQNARGAFVEATARRVGKYYANDANSDRVDGYALLDATIGTDLRLGGVNLAIFASGRNLSDEEYAASVYINGVNGRYLEPGLQRNFAAGVSLRARGAAGQQGR